MESLPQNPEFRNNPENVHSFIFFCVFQLVQCEQDYGRYCELN